MCIRDSRQGGDAGALGEVADDEVVNGHGKGDDEAVEHAGHDLGQDDLAEGQEAGSAQVLGRLINIGVQLPQLGHHR